MDGPRDYYTKWSKQDKDKYHMIPFICRIQKNSKWTYLQNTNRLRNIENKFMVTEGEEEGRLYQEFAINIYTPLYLKCPSWITALLW